MSCFFLLFSPFRFVSPQLIPHLWYFEFSRD
jgi:hypothetical protein